MIEPLPLLSTVPEVRRARVWTPVGAIAAVTFMVPELLPFSAPIRSVPAETLFSSVLVRDSRSDTSVPKSITVLFVCGAMVTTPLEEVVPMVAPRFSLFAVKEIALDAETLLSNEIVAAVEVIETEPEAEVMFALEAEVVVMFPEPDRRRAPDD